MKTSKLSGVLLDYWVAKAEGYAAEIFTDEKGPFVVRTMAFDSGGLSRGPFLPSTQWHDGGPIIERELIQILPVINTAYWLCGYSKKPLFRDSAPLVAAMRAYVASKFGYEVADMDATT